MCAYLLKPDQFKEENQPRWAVWSERQFERFKNGYSSSLAKVLDHAGLVGLTLIGIIILNVFLLKLVVTFTLFPRTGQRPSPRSGDLPIRAISFPGDQQEARAAAADCRIEDPRSAVGQSDSPAGEHLNQANVYVALKAASPSENFPPTRWWRACVRN